MVHLETLSLLLRYTYGQPVAGSATVNVCRNLQRYYIPLDLVNPQAELEEPCDKQTKQVGKPSKRSPAGGVADLLFLHYFAD